MITDLANLGPSLRTSDLGGAKAKDQGRSGNAKSGQPEPANSFDQVLQKKVSDKPTSSIGKTDKDVRANSFKKDPAPVRRDEDQRQPVQPEMDREEVRSSKNEPRTAPKETKSSEEPRSVKEKSASEKPGKKSESASQNREQVMLEFMDSMESEFGIPPQRMVEAMTEISESDQLKSPEDSASQVIAQLDLPKDQEQRALALYVGMLAQLQQAQQPQWKSPMVEATAAAAVTAPVMMTSQQRRTALNNSLDHMNQKFFMKDPAMAMKPAAPQEATMKSVAPEMSSPDDLATDSLSGGEFPKDQFSLGGRMPADQLSPSFGQGADGMKPQQPVKPQQNYGASVQKLQDQLQNSSIDPNSPEGQKLAKALAALSVSAAALDEGLKTDPKNMQALRAEQSLNANANATAASANAAALAALGVDSDDGGDDMDDSGDGGSSSRQFGVNQPNVHLSQHQRAEGPAAAGSSFGAMMAGAQTKQAGEAEKQANIQQLMNQAEYMIKKGGGEAKIQMAPEGIGQVHMKVTVLDGKVNLEMSAETKEAKKLLESSMNDLKSSLGHHNLSMEHVKVDVGNQLQSDNSRQEAQTQQRQMDMRQDQSKDQAREFWSQFNDGGGFDRRGTFFDNPAIRAYGGTSRQVQALTPNSPGAIAEKRYAGSGKGRGLNLVA